MKKKLLKIFSIIFSIATLMPTTTSVVWAVKTSQSTKSEKKEKTEEESDGGLSKPMEALKITDTITPPFYGCEIELKKVPKKTGHKAHGNDKKEEQNFDIYHKYILTAKNIIYQKNQLRLLKTKIPQIWELLILINQY